MMDFLKKFEIYLGDRVPKTLIHILRTAGYDSSMALKSLNPETINEMEIYISNLEQNFDGSSYTPFTRFLPGHRAKDNGNKDFRHRRFSEQLIIKHRPALYVILDSQLFHY